jgi:Na+-driven multidrug efflux pump
MFINGVGKVKLQMYTSIIGAVLFILLAILLIKHTDLGIAGLVIASIISNFNGIIIAPIQYKKIINKKAKGIWNL